MPVPASKDDFVRLWTSAQSGVAAYISAMVPDYHSAEDILQECASILLKKFSQFDTSRPFLPWAIGVARTEILSRRRRYSIEKLVFDEPALESLAKSYEEFGDEVDDRVEALRHCARKANGRARELLDMRYGENMKPQAIAKRTGSNPHATSVALSRIRDSLRECIEKWLKHHETADDHNMVSLTSAFIDERLSPADAQLLRDAVINDSSNAKCVALELVFHRQLYDIFNGQRVVRLQDELTPSSDDWRHSNIEFTPIKDNAGGSEDDSQNDNSKEAPVVASSPPVPLKRRPLLGSHWKKSAAAVLLIVTAVTAIVLHRSPKVAQVTATPAAATLVADVDAQWGEETHAKGDSFASGTFSRLTSGFAELHFAAGATVLVQAPAEFAVRSNREVFISSGKIFATVPGGGFVVNTPVTTITDLGTEFGVDVSDPYHTQVAVIKGKVAINAKSQSQDGASPGTVAASTILAEGQAVSVSEAGISAASAPAISQQFTRTLETSAGSLDMVDLVSGGDGTTHRRGTGIDAQGNFGNIAPVIIVESDGIYHPVDGLPAVDGVFLPKGSPDATQLDSAGDSFKFPAAAPLSNNQIWAGGPIPVPPGAEQVRSTLDGIDYSAPGHGLLFLHGARGITFDLNAIRRLHPSMRIIRFRCLFGNAYLGPDVVKTNAWAFTDGVLQFSSGNKSNREKPTPASFAIKDSDHYLTLATGFASIKDYPHSWIIAADPALDLEPR